METPNLEVDDPFGVDFENILNFRDVGKTVNEFLGRKLVREGLLFRSARPDDATLEDRKRLIGEFGLKTVMDLRTKTEHLNMLKKREADLKVPALLASNAALAEPLQIPGLQYLEIKLTGRAFERHLLGQLSWWNFIKFLTLFICGWRMQAIAILGREVMLPRGLIGLGLDTLDASQKEVAEALDALLQPGALPMVIHCTQGKDRTGIIVILALMIMDVPIKAIDFDYKLSDEALLPEKEARIKEIEEIGLTAEFGETADGLVQGVADHMDSKYGGLNAYLDGLGFKDDKRKKLRELLMS